MINAWFYIISFIKIQCERNQKFLKNVISQVKHLISCHSGNQVSIYHAWNFSSLNTMNNNLFCKNKPPFLTGIIKGNSCSICQFLCCSTSEHALRFHVIYIDQSNFKSLVTKLVVYNPVLWDTF